MKELIPKENQQLWYLNWQDAHSSGGWMSENELKEEVNREVCNVEDVGWIVYEDDKEIHLVSRVCRWVKSDGSEYGMYQRIPVAWVIKRKLISIGEAS